MPMLSQGKREKFVIPIEVKMHMHLIPCNPDNMYMGM